MLGYALSSVRVHGFAPFFESVCGVFGSHAHQQVWLKQGVPSSRHTAFPSSATAQMIGGQDEAPDNRNFSFVGTIRRLVAPEEGRKLKAEVEALTELPNEIGEASMVLKMNKIKVGSERAMTLNNRKFPGTYVYCKAHTDHPEQTNCKVAWRVHAVPRDVVHELEGDTNFQGETGLVVFRSPGPHKEQESKESKRWLALKLKKIMANSDKTLAAARQDLLSDVDYHDRVPRALKAAKHKSHLNSTNPLRHQPPEVEGRGALREMLVSTFARPPAVSAANDAMLWVPCADVVLEAGATIIPFGCDHLLNEVRDYCARATDLDILMDFTHDVGFGHFKVGSVGIAACHWDDNHYCWSNTDLPGFFVISHREVTPAAIKLVKCFLDALLAQHQMDIRPRVKRSVTDDGAALGAALEEHFSGHLHMDCLQHAKGRIAKHPAKWRYGVKTRMVQRWMEVTASMTGPMFSVCWRRLYDVLEAAVIQPEEDGAFGAGHMKEDKVVKYMKEKQVQFNEDLKMYTSFWRYGLDITVPARSTYLANSQEALWITLANLKGTGDEVEDIKSVLEKCGRHFQDWKQDCRFARCVPKPTGTHLFQANLMRGLGIWQNKGPICDKPFRRATVSLLRTFPLQDIAVAINPLDGSWQRAWVFTKNPDTKLEPERAQCYAELVGAKNEDDVVESLTRRDMLDNGYPSYRVVRKLFIEHTMVYETPDGELLETHSDFIKKGVSEHWLFMGMLLGKPGFQCDEPAMQGDPPPAKIASARAKAKAISTRATADAARATPKALPSPTPRISHLLRRRHQAPREQIFLDSTRQPPRKRQRIAMCPLPDLSMEEIRKEASMLQSRFVPTYKKCIRCAPDRACFLHRNKPVQHNR